MTTHDHPMGETSTGYRTLDDSEAVKPSPSPTAFLETHNIDIDIPDQDEQPTAFGRLFTRQDGSRVYITSHRTLAQHMLSWGWPLHPSTSEDWCRRTGTYLFHAPSDWHILRAEPIAALPSDAYRRWKQAVLHATEPSSIPHTERYQRQRQLVRQSQMRLDSRYRYRNEAYRRTRTHWVPATELGTWDLDWPDSIAPGSIEMSDPRFGDYVRCGEVYGYNQDGTPVSEWYWYQPMPRPQRMAREDYDGGRRDCAAWAEGPDGLHLIPLWHNEGDDNDSLHAIEGALDAEPLFPSLVTAYTIGDGKHARQRRVARVEKMLAWLAFIYGTRAAHAAEVHLLHHCPDFATARDARTGRLAQRGNRQAIPPQLRSRRYGQRAA